MGLSMICVLCTSVCADVGMEGCRRLLKQLWEHSTIVCTYIHTPIHTSDRALKWIISLWKKHACDWGLMQQSSEPCACRL